VTPPTPGDLSLLVVDDERPALEDLARMLTATPGVGAVQTAQSATEALRHLDDRAFDVVFLDVRMPGLDGLALGRTLARFATPPALVFVSAYDEGAVEAFALRAVDYLVKPVSRRRLDETLGRLAAATPHTAPATVAAAAGERPADDLVPVDSPRGSTRLVPRASVLYLQAHGDYVRVVCEDGRFLLRGRLADLEQRWQAHGFQRVHRGFVANVPRAVEVRPLLNGTAVLVFPGGHEVPIARRQVADLRRSLAL